MRCNGRGRRGAGGATSVGTPRERPAKGGGRTCCGELVPLCNELVDGRALLRQELGRHLAGVGLALAAPCRSHGGSVQQGAIAHPPSSRNLKAALVIDERGLQPRRLRAACCLALERRGAPTCPRCPRVLAGSRLARHVHGTAAGPSCPGTAFSKPERRSVRGVGSALRSRSLQGVHPRPFSPLVCWCRPRAALSSTVVAWRGGWRLGWEEVLLRFELYYKLGCQLVIKWA